MFAEVHDWEWKDSIIFWHISGEIDDIGGSCRVGMILLLFIIDDMHHSDIQEILCSVQRYILPAW